MRVALCADTESCCNPGLLGLEGEALASQRWLSLYSTGEEARAGIVADGRFEEAWVASCDDVEPINLAAALKADCPDLRVCLVEFNGCGSLFSRAHTAMIDEVLERAAFLKRYGEMKAQNLATGQSEARPFTGTRQPNGAEVVAYEEPREPQTQVQLERLQPSQAITVIPKGSCFVLPVVSGSGGAGKSSVSALAALIAQQAGKRTLLLDYDLQFGDADILVGAEGAHSIDEVLSQPTLLERLAAPNGGDLAVLAAPARIESAEEVVRRIPELLNMLVGEFDVIVANTGAAWAEQHAALLERASAALFLVDQRASSVRACRHAFELCMRCGIATGPFRFAVNRCAKNAPLTSIDVSCALQGVPVFELKEGGRDVEDYLSAGAARDLLDAGNDFCSSLESLLVQLMPGFAAPEREAGAATSTRRGPKRKARHAQGKRGWIR